MGARPQRWELADIVRQHGAAYRATHRLSHAQRRALRAVEQCRTAVRKEMTLDADEFLRRWLLHVLPRGFMRVRHYGLLANRTRAAALTRCRELLHVEPSPNDPTAAVDESMVERILRLTGLDVLRCPFCGEGPLVRIERLTPDTS